MEFEWDENKGEQNEQKHRISFVSAATMLKEGDYLAINSNYPSEERYIAVGKINERYVAVVFTMRNGKYRIISARSARDNERVSYERDKRKNR